jgi:hypothetical protein
MAKKRYASCVRVVGDVHDVQCQTLVEPEPVSHVSIVLPKDGADGELYGASQRFSAELVDKEVQASSLDIALPDVVEVPIVDMSICLVDLDVVNLLTYDLSLSALRAPLRSSVVEDQASFVACKDELSQLGNWAVAKMRAAHFEARKRFTVPGSDNLRSSPAAPIETANPSVPVDVRPRHLPDLFTSPASLCHTPVSSPVDSSKLDSETSSVADVDDTVLSFQPLASPLSQTAAGWGPLFRDQPSQPSGVPVALQPPQVSGQECKQQ